MRYRKVTLELAGQFYRNYPNITPDNVGQAEASVSIDLPSEESDIASMSPMTLECKKDE